MRLTRFFPLILLAIVMVMAACNDRNAKKRIAELETRLRDLEGKKANSPRTTAAEAVKAVEEKPDGPLPVASFETVDYDFGTINEGQVVEHTFKFTNTGQAPLIIQSAQASCGCTAPDWSKQPIQPGETGFVKARFDSNGRTNIQNKSITVTANTFPKQTVLRFKAMVMPKAKDAPADGPLRK